MDWKTFIIQMTGYIAWPLTVLCILFILKDKIAGLLPRVEKLKFKDAEIEFSKALQEIETSSSNKLMDESVEQAIEREKLIELSKFAPNSVVHLCWAKIDEILLDLYLESVPPGERKPLMKHELISLLNREQVPRTTISAIETLRRIRRIMMGTPEIHIDHEEVEPYIAQTFALVSEFTRNQANKSSKRDAEIGAPS